MESRDFRETFLSIFDRHVQNQIIEFGKTIQNTKADLYLLMARKAACFVDCLEELGLTKLEGYATSDRILDMDISWVENKDVVIIDDIIISGTTLCEIVNKVKRANAKSVKVIILGVNKIWFQEKLFIDDNGVNCLQKPYLVCKNSECIKLCADIVASLSIFPRPYSVDFPIFKNARIPESVFDEIINSPYCDSDNLTSCFQSQNNVLSITLTPRHYLLSLLDNYLGCNISDNSLVKIRMYTKLYENNRSKYSKSNKGIHTHATTRNIYSVKIMPIVVLNPIEKHQIDDLFCKIVDRFPDDKTLLTANFVTIQSKLRLIQHIAACILGKLWVDIISNITTSNINLKQDYRSLGFLFTPETILLTEKIIDNSLKLFAKINIHRKNISTENADQFLNKPVANNIVSIKNKLSEPFVWLYYNKEIPTRIHVKSVGVDALSKGKTTRLKEGFSIPTLKKIIRDNEPTFDTDKITSLFIDQATDLGIAVPITGERNGFLFRAFRHGEDVVFSEREEKLSALLLDVFLKNSGKEAIPHLWAEKLLVLLIKIGVQKRFLTEFIYDSPKNIIKIARVKNYKFGQVATEQVLDPFNLQDSSLYLSEENKSEWLSNMLIEKGILKENVDGQYLVMEDKVPIMEADDFIVPLDVDTNETLKFPDVDREALLEVESIGEIFGELCNNGQGKEYQRKDPHLKDSDMVTLTSCLLPNDISLSMAAEIAIFHAKWDNLKSFVVREARNSQYLSIAYGFRQNSSWWTAINSGQIKYKLYHRKEGFSLIKRIESQFTERSKAREWAKFWSNNTEWTRDTIENELHDLIKQEAEFLFATNISIRILDILFRRLSYRSGINEKEKENINNQILLLQNSLKNAEEENKKNIKKEIRKNQDRYRDIDGKEVDVIKEVDDYINDFNIFVGDIPLDLFDIYESYRNDAQSIDEIKKLVNEIIKYLDKLNISAKLILEKVDLIVSPIGKIEYSQTYPHVLFVDIKYSTESQRVDIERNIYSAFNKFEKNVFNYKERTSPGNMSFYILPHKNNPIDYGFWIVGKGDFAKKRLVELILHIENELKDTHKYKFIFFPNQPQDSTISVQAKNNSNIKTALFFDKYSSIIFDANLQSFTEKEIVTITSNNSNVLEESEKEIIRDSQDLYYKDNQSVISVKKPYHFDYAISIFKHKKINKMTDIGIITILPPESQAINEVLKNYSKQRGKDTNRIFHSGYLDGDNCIHSIVMTQQLTQGNESVISAYNDLVSEYNPKIMILFGIAGSISEKNKLCDVCIANQVIGYDKRKEGETIDRRGITFNTSAKLLPFINEFFNIHGEDPLLDACKDSFEDKFKVDFRPLGAGNAVVGNPLSEIKQWLKTFNDKTAAVETEAVGFCNAAYEEDVKKINERKGVIVLRGISDHADFDKDDKWRLAASRNAAITLKELFLIFPDLNTI